jgi:hypothetical protein
MYISYSHDLSDIWYYQGEPSKQPREAISKGKPLAASISVALWASPDVVDLTSKVSASNFFSGKTSHVVDRLEWLFQLPGLRIEYGSFKFSVQENCADTHASIPGFMPTSVKCQTHCNAAQVQSEWPLVPIRKFVMN